MLIDRWYKAAHDKDAFFSPRPDQNSLSIILYQAGISDFVSLNRIPHTEYGEKVQPTPFSSLTATLLIMRIERFPPSTLKRPLFYEDFFFL